MIKIKIELNNVTEINEKVKDTILLFQKGDINIIFDAWIISDYEDRWGMKPWFYFLKALINKYLYQFPLEAGFKPQLASDTAYIYARIKSLLNSYRSETGRYTPEEEIRKEVETEIQREIEQAEKEER